jgi:hypothetical protein
LVDFDLDLPVVVVGRDDFGCEARGRGDLALRGGRDGRVEAGRGRLDVGFDHVREAISMKSSGSMFVCVQWSRTSNTIWRKWGSGERMHCLAEREGGEEREEERERENGQSVRVPLFVHRNYNTFDTIYVLYVYVPRCHHPGTFPNPP